MRNSRRRAPDADTLRCSQRWAARVLATGFGLGYSPFAPGTAGSLLPFAVVFLVGPLSPWAILLAAALVYVVGVPVSTWGERLWGQEDPGHVVIDEVAGYLLSIAFVPAQSEIGLLVAGFFVFRLFDIIKPPPGRLAEHLPGGWGVMSDDVVAGVYSNLVLQIVARLGWL